MKRQGKHRYQQNNEVENSAVLLSTRPPTGTFGKKVRGKVDNSFTNLNLSVNLDSSFESITMDRSLQDNQNILNQSTSNCSILGDSTPSFKLNLKRTKSVRFDEQKNEEEQQFPSFTKKNSTSRIIIPILKNSTQKLNNTSFSQLNISFNQFQSQRSNVPPRVSILDDKKNQKRRYASLLDSLRKTRKKYFDDIFPPGASSIYFSSKDTRFGDIKWVRICQIMKPKYCILFSKQPRQKCRIKSGEVPIPYMVIGLSALKHQNNYLSYIFEDPHINDFGIYLLRIFIEGVWRYVIVDDYIPVLVKDRKYVPVFLSVEQTQKHSIQIWPFLLQKAYAKVYSTYESLFNGNVEDFINQATGSIMEKFELSKHLTDFELQRHLNNNSSIILLGKQLNKTTKQIGYHPAVKMQTENLGFLERITEELNVHVEDPLGNKEVSPMLINDIGSFYQEALVFRNNDNHFNISSHIKQSSSNKDSMSIRSFTVGSTTSCDISLYQKDKKFFRKGYDYSWARLIIAMKQAEGIRWVKGTYLKKKCVQISCILDPGQYYIILMVDWGSRVYDLHLNYSGNSEISFERVPHADHPTIFSDTCVDLAQRFGEFQQISSNLCSYRHCDGVQGLIIDNINNQSETKEVMYSKSYNKSMKILSGLKAVNQDFIKNRNTITTRIKPKGHYTLIIKVKNGEDLDVIDCFGIDD